MRISDWSSDVCSSDLTGYLAGFIGALRIAETVSEDFPICLPEHGLTNLQVVNDVYSYLEQNQDQLQRSARSVFLLVMTNKYPCAARSEEHTSALKSLMRISYAVICLNKKNTCRHEE